MIIKEFKNPKSVKNSNDVFEIIQPIINQRAEEDRHKEFFYALGFTSKNTLLYVDIVTIGTVNCCNPSVRESFRLALVKNATSIIVCHNHPSGDTVPSQEDKQFTKKLMQASKIIEVTVLDHLIIGDDKFFSFSDSGILED